MVYLSSMAEVVSVDKAGRIVSPKAVRDAAGIDERAKLLVAGTAGGRGGVEKHEVGTPPAGDGEPPADPRATPARRGTPRGECLLDRGAPALCRGVPLRDGRMAD